MNSNSWAVNGVLSGRQISDILTLQTGVPFTPLMQTRTPNTGSGSQFPNRPGSGELPSDERSIERWFDVSAFAAPPQYTFGNSGRGILYGPCPLYGPGPKQIDLCLFKSFPILGSPRLDLRAEAVNALNTPQFNNPNPSIGFSGAALLLTGRAFAVFLLVAAAAFAAPVSYSREVAPLFAMHCNGCHGDAGGLGLRTYQQAMLGGNLGRVIVPGDPERSLLIHFVDGRRGENHRMPKDGLPLSNPQIGLLRRWIEEGAKEDQLPTPVWRHVLSAVPMDMNVATRVLCRVPVPAYLVVRVTDPGPKRTVLWEDAVSVKTPMEKGDVAEPGQMIHWDLRAGYGWPRRVRVELEIRYAAGDPTGAEFHAETLPPPPHR